MVQSLSAKVWYTFTQGSSEGKRQKYFKYKNCQLVSEIHHHQALKANLKCLYKQHEHTIFKAGVKKKSLHVWVDFSLTAITKIPLPEEGHCVILEKGFSDLTVAQAIVTPGIPDYRHNILTYMAILVFIYCIVY